MPYEVVNNEEKKQYWFVEQTNGEANGPAIAIYKEIMDKLKTIEIVDIYDFSDFLNKFAKNDNVIKFDDIQSNELFDTSGYFRSFVKFDDCKSLVAEIKMNGMYYYLFMDCMSFNNKWYVIRTSALANYCTNYDQNYGGIISLVDLVSWFQSTHSSIG